MCLVVSGLLVGCSSSDGAGSSTASTTPGSAATTVGAAPASEPPSTAAPAVTGATDAPAATTDAPATSLVAPDGDAFWTPPSPLPGDGPGDLIWARPLADAPAGSVGWQVLYRSESVAGVPIAVSGLVIAPAGSAGSNVVLSWAHGTTGMGDQCAPSRTIGGAFSVETLLAGVAVGRGWTFVATDYEGLGTPGVHPYLVGGSEGRGVLDIVRAAAQLSGSGVTPASPVAVFGHSQGGHAALMAAELAPTYAPELDLIGTVAGAPPGELALIASASAAGTAGGTGGYALMMKAGFLAAYPDLRVAAAVDASAAPLLTEVADTCTDAAFDLAAEITVPQPDPAADPAWKAALDASSPGSVVPEGPVLIVQGDADTTVPPRLSKAIRDGYCSLGVTVQRTVYPGQDHVGVVIAAIGEIQSWLQGRIDGAPAPDNCADPQPV